MKWIDRIQIILGAWILISPWILNFSSLDPALWSNIFGGALVILLGLWRIFGQSPKIDI